MSKYWRRNTVCIKTKQVGQIIFLKANCIRERRNGSIIFSHFNPQAYKDNLTKCNMMQPSFIHAACNYGTLVTGVMQQSSQWEMKRRRRLHLCPLRSLQHLWGDKTSMKSLITAWSIKSMTRDNKCFRNTRENMALRGPWRKQQAFSWGSKDEYNFVKGRGVWDREDTLA